MTKFDFSALTAHYPEIIDQMPTVFTSHQFILALAQQYQADYVSALFAYRNTLHQGTPAPFLNVHRELASHLRDFPALVQHVRYDAPSEDIFRNSQFCSEWRKTN